MGKNLAAPGGAITHDDMDSDVDAQDYESTSSTLWCERHINLGAGADLTLETITLTCLQDTVVEANYMVCAAAQQANAMKSQMYIDGVAQGESAFWSVHTIFLHYYDQGNKAVLAGARIVYLNAHNYLGVARTLYWAGGVFGACCKLV